MRRYFHLLIATLLGAVLISAALPAQAQEPAAAVEHVVQPGENLYRISLRYGVTVQAIASANNIANPNIIVVGQKLAISGGTNSGATGGQTGGTSGGDTTNTGGTPAPSAEYTVIAGDNLSKIARTFNTTVQAIASANNIANVNLIFVGQKLVIPGASGGTGTDTNTGTGTGTDTNTGTGTGTGTTSPNPSGFEIGGHILGHNNFQQMRDAGMTWAKVQIRFDVGDNADITAPAINDAHLSGFKILLGIVGSKEEMASMGFEAYSTAYAEFVGNVARLGPEAIEVWNEPNLEREWPAGQISAANYTTLLRKSYESIKAVNSNVMVVSGAPAPTGFFGGCTANGCDDNFFLAGMNQAGAANYMDCIGVHYNEGIVAPNQRSGDPRGSSSHYSRYFFGMLDLYHNTFGGRKPVCWTELGYLSPEGFSTGAPAGFDWGNNNTLAEHTQWLGEAASLSRSSGRVRLMIVWNVNFQDAAPDPSGMYAIIRPDGTCPACGTLAGAMR